MARLGFVTLGADVPSTRFRFHPYLERLRRAGHTCREWIAKPSVYDYYRWMGWRLSHTYSDLRRYLQVLDAGWRHPDAIYLERYALHIPSTKLDQQIRLKLVRQFWSHKIQRESSPEGKQTNTYSLQASNPFE
ncbi:MAG: hypothetical protein ACOVNV_10725, partial [Pirellulaceae bacterium]